MADFPVVIGGEVSDPVEIKLSAIEVLTGCGNMSADVRKDDLLTIAMLQGGIRIGGLIIESNPQDKAAPLLQFTRHFRNACAHDGHWNFLHGERKHPAELRDLSLDASLHGQPALWNGGCRRACTSSG